MIDFNGRLNNFSLLVRLPARGFFYLVVFLLLSLLVAGCRPGQSATTSSTPAKKVITIVDSAGRQVEVPYRPARIVVSNSDVAELIIALGSKDKIVGVSDTTLADPLLAELLPGVATVGQWSQPNVEKILELKPDIVFGYASFLKNAEKITQAGIPLVLLDCYKPETLARDITTLGQILGQEERAKAYIQTMDEYMAQIKAAVAGQKATPIYLELYSDFKTVTDKTGGGQMILVANGLNVAGKEATEYPKVSPEWVLAKQPEVIVRVLSSSVPTGYKIHEVAPWQKLLEGLIRRPGWSDIPAVKNKKVYLMSSDIYTGPRAVVGMAYLAKWLHPEAAKKLDPEAIHREFLEKFLGVKLDGLWVYP